MVPPDVAPDVGDADAEERALLAGLRARDEASYEKLVRSHTPRLLGVARRFLRSEEDARDAVQDAFLSAFRSIDGFEGGARLSTWLHRIAVNACLMKLRTRRRKPEGSIEDLLPRFLEDGHMDQPAGPWREGADTLLEREENRVRIREAIDRLPDNYRTVLLLRDIEGLDTDETADALGLTRASVKTRLHRARQALKTQLDRHFQGSAP